MPKSHGEGDGTPLQYSRLENPMDGGAWWAAVHGVAKSQTRLSDFTFTHWRRKWQPTPVFLPGESQGWGSLVGCRLWVAQGQTRLKQLNSSSSIQKAKIIIYAPTFPTWGNLVDLTWILSFRFFIPKITNNLIHQTIVELKLGTWSKQNALCLMNIKIYKSCTPCKLLHVF